MQKCQKLLANLGSEDTVGRPKNYQAKVPGTVSRTKRSANFSLPQVKHFLGCKKSTKSNTCGSLFTCSGALLFSSTKTAKFQNPCISGHGCFCVHFVPRFDARDSSPEPETPQIFASRPLTICRMARSTEKRKKVGLFQRFFHPSMSIFPRFPTFPAFQFLYVFFFFLFFVQRGHNFRDS